MLYDFIRKEKISRLSPGSIYLNQFINTKILLYSILLLILPGCTTKEEDILQIMVGGTWGIYMVATAIIYYLSGRRKLNKRFVITGLITFLILSIIGLFLIKGGSIIHWSGEPEYGIGERLNYLGIILSGLLVGIVLSPLIFLYALILFYVFRAVKIKQVETIIIFITIVYVCSILLSYYMHLPTILIWFWPLLPFSNQ